MSKGLTKSEALNWLELMREFMAADLPLPPEACRHIDQLEQLRMFLKRDMLKLGEKIQKALYPAQGQRLNPETALQDSKVWLWEVLAYVDFCGKIIFDQRFEIERLRQNVVVSTAGASFRKSSTRVKKAPKRKTRVS